MVELSETAGPFGDTDATSVTVPEKLLRLVRVMVADPEEPWAIAKVVGLGVALKSGVVLEPDRTVMLPVMCCRCIEQK